MRVIEARAACRRPAARRQGARPRRGFTLIELMVVILVISMLIALLLPAIFSVQANVRNGQVQTEIRSLESALADFKAQYGVEPPSRIVLCERADHWTDPNHPLAQEITRSRALIRRIWPQFQFDFRDTANGFSDGRDINGNGTVGNPLQLRGAECLAFFLGGMFESQLVDANSVTRPIPALGPTQPQRPLQVAASGFSKNALNPFDRAGTSRVGPFYEFGSGRLVDVDGNGMPEYVDPLPGQTMPYLYASSNEGRGYDPKDLALFDKVSDVSTDNRDLRDVYRQGAQDLRNPGPQNKLSQGHNPKSYQIISPGVDQAYGVGGSYEAGKPDAPYGRILTPAQRAAREFDRDNITNFQSGKLVP